MARLIQFQGREIEVPDNFTDDQIAQVLAAPPSAPAAPAAPVDPTIPEGARTPEGRTKLYVRPDTPSRPPTDPWTIGGAARNLAIGAQGVGEGLRDIALAPFDLAAGAQDVVFSGVNKLFGTNIPPTRRASQLAGDAVDALGIPHFDEKNLSPQEKLGYNINRFGTQAAGTGAALVTRAPAVLEATKPAADFATRTLDTLARPYTVNPTRTAVGDAIAGAGAGAGVTAAQEFLPEEPTTTTGQVAKAVANFAAPLVGAIGASGAQGLVEGLAGMLRNIANRRTDVNVPVNPKTGAPYRVADSERAAADLQSRATGAPRAVAQDIRENAADLTQPKLPGETPVDPSAVPTSGLLSRDTGLVQAEEQARLRNRGDFVQRDQNVKEAAGQRVNSMRDPEANQGAVSTAAENARESRMAAVEQRVQELEDLTRRVGQARQQQGAEFAPAANAEARANASRRLDQTIVDEGYVPARTEKNRQFDTAPGRNEQLPADDIFEAIDRIRARANDLAPGTLPEDFMRRLNALRPQMVESDAPAAPRPATSVDESVSAELERLNGTTSRLYEDLDKRSQPAAGGANDNRSFYGDEWIKMLTPEQRGLFKRRQELNDQVLDAKLNANYEQVAGMLPRGYTAARSKTKASDGGPDWQDLTGGNFHRSIDIYDPQGNLVGAIGGTDLHGINSTWFKDLRQTGSARPVHEVALEAARKAGAPEGVTDLNFERSGVRDTADQLSEATRRDPGGGELVNIGGPGTARGGDMADLRKFIGAAEQRAQQSGNFDLADNLRSLRSSINRTIEGAPGYAEANANYRQFADRYRPERNDEGAKFTREIDRSGNNAEGMPNRGATPPSETAGRFLSGPEKAQALNRMLAGAPNEAAGQAAVRDYMRGDFATAALNADGTINPARASAWARNNADILEQFPAVRAEFDNIVQQTQRGERLSQDADAFLDQARRTRNATETDVDRGAIGTLLREDPRDVASKILNGGYGTEKRLDEINALVRSDADAARGWKAAVSEVLVDKVTSSRKIGETSEVQYARLAKEFKDNEAILAKVYSPEEMNTLRQGHKLLEFFKEAEKRSVSGSQTAERLAIPGWLQLGARTLYGDLKGGGVIRRWKLLIEQLPTNKQQADEIVNAAWFNPDLAAYLLEKPIKNPNIPMFNVNLRRLIALDAGARESGPVEK